MMKQINIYYSLPDPDPPLVGVSVDIFSTHWQVQRFSSNYGAAQHVTMVVAQIFRVLWIDWVISSLFFAFQVINFYTRFSVICIHIRKNTYFSINPASAKRTLRIHQSVNKSKDFTFDNTLEISICTHSSLLNFIGLTKCNLIKNELNHS